MVSGRISNRLGIAMVKPERESLYCWKSSGTRARRPGLGGQVRCLLVVVAV